MKIDLVDHRASGVWRYRIQGSGASHDVLIFSTVVRFLQTPIYGRFWGDPHDAYRCLVDGRWPEKDVLYETPDSALEAAQEHIKMTDEQEDGETINMSDPKGC